AGGACSAAGPMVYSRPPGTEWGRSRDQRRGWRERSTAMPKFRHIAIVCQDPRALAEWYQKAFDLAPVYHDPEKGITELTEGDFNLTLLNAEWVKENTG